MQPRLRLRRKWPPLTFHVPHQARVEVRGPAGRVGPELQEGPEAQDSVRVREGLLQPKGPAVADPVDLASPVLPAVRQRNGC